MHPAALLLLRCPSPSCSGPLILEAAEDGEITDGSLRCDLCRISHPIVAGIPRFVPAENYAESFGFEWGIFAGTQYDSETGTSATRDRLLQETGLSWDELAGKRVLEVGCGGGRFSDVLLKAGAEVWAVDMSTAVEQNALRHKGESRLHLAQASLEALPVQRRAFDLVICLGVLQHTPSPRRSFARLAECVRPGGRLAVDIYAAHPKQSLHWKYAARPLTKRLDPKRLYGWIDRSSRVTFPVAKRLRAIPKIGKVLARGVPIFTHDGFIGRVPPDQERRYAVLETLDALTPRYDRPRSARALRRWFESCGFSSVEVHTTMSALNWGYGDLPLGV